MAAFENPFKRTRELSPEEAEARAKKVIQKELMRGVDVVTMHLAFVNAQKENKVKKLGLTNNFLLNMLKNEALGMSGSVEDTLYDGASGTTLNIESEIETMRDRLTDEEKRS